MAKKTKKLNTNLDDPVKGGDDFSDSYFPRDGLVDDSYSEPEPAMESLDALSDDITYTMGDIQVGDADEEDEEFKKASELLAKDADDEEGDDKWIEDDVNFKDEDPFLDMAEEFDMDNPAEFD